MKKNINAILIASVVLLLLFSSSSFAQGIKAGFKIGVNNANIFGEDVSTFEEDLGVDLKSKWGLSAGGFVQFSIGKVIAIQPELLYTMKGASVKEEVLGETLKVSFNLTYLEVPVLVKFMIPTPGGVKPSLFVGPAVAINLSANMKMEYAGDTDEEDFSDEIEGTEFGLVIGGSLDFGKLSFDIRYNLGLSTVSVYEGEEIKNGVISLKVGYSF